MQFLSAHAQHIGSRESQEDSFGFGEGIPEHGGFLAILCDGMGGMEHGELASQTAVKAFREAYARKGVEESVPDALERSVRETNQAVLDLADELGTLENIGTTLMAAVALEGKLFYISVGDSGLFFLSNYELSLLNRPHIFGNHLDRAAEKGLISREEAERHPEREALTSFIGIDSLEEVDRNLEAVPLQAGDSVLLASDGLFNTLSPQEIAAVLNGPRAEWAEKLVKETLNKRHPHQDNVTVVTVTAA